MHILHGPKLYREVWYSQEQYLEEGIEWDEVEVEFNESLINCFHRVCPLAC